MSNYPISGINKDRYVALYEQQHSRQINHFPTPQLLELIERNKAKETAAVKRIASTERA